MSTLVQPLPPPWSYSEHNPVFASQGHSTAFEYLGDSFLPQQSTFSALPAPQVSSGTARPPFYDPIARRPSQRSSETMFRSPPVRDRTPIRHHRSSLPRTRSSSRSNALFAYASEQQKNQQQVRQQFQRQQLPMLASQAVPTGDMMFRAPTYAIPTSHSYGSPSLYYNSPNLSQETAQHGIESSLFRNEQSQTRYYPLGESALQSANPVGANFTPQEALFIQNTTSSQPGLSALASNTQAKIQPYAPTPAPLESSREDFRGAVSRPKPKCFDHGCNGREFSTFSNLLRHQRERSGNASKATCPHCGTEFTRTTARNGHLLSGKCKGRPDQSQGGLDEGD